MFYNNTKNIFRIIQEYLRNIFNYSNTKNMFNNDNTAMPPPQNSQNTNYEQSNQTQMKGPSDIDNILNELTGLTEYPSIIIGNINKKLMLLPKKILISVIQFQQKCIPLIVEDPYLAYAHVTNLLHPSNKSNGLIHENIIF